ncbi:MAG: L-histidine N(alpha)-methyltransferase [Myxococcota bacterium]
MSSRPPKRSQVIELFMRIAHALGRESDREIAELAGVTPENVANWRAGTVKEFKRQTLTGIADRIADQIAALRGHRASTEIGLRHGLIELEVEESSAPDALQRDFSDRLHYDYLGHRFLYYEPQGALAWENLIRESYTHRAWLDGISRCAREWFGASGSAHGGILNQALGLRRGAQRSGLELVSLGAGEGGKEKVLLHMLSELTYQPAWLALALVDVSIPLLMRAARTTRSLVFEKFGGEGVAVLPCCADFEEGELNFLERLPRARSKAEARRLVLLFGNVMGSLRDEERFFGEKLDRMLAPGDYVWLEVNRRLERASDDPMHAMTGENTLTASSAHRRLVLEGPYRRFEAAGHRRPANIHTRVSLREGDETCAVPGSVNYCQDLVIEDEGRVVTMLYSRRYEEAGLRAWLGERDFDVEDSLVVDGGSSKESMIHVLARKR